MTRFAILAAAVLLSPGADFQSVTARNARVKYEKELFRAREYYVKQELEATKQYVRQLKSTLVSETKAGNLEEANKLQAEIERMEKVAAPVDEGGNEDAEQFSGRWLLKFSTQERPITYEFDDGKVTVVGNQKTTKGRLHFSQDEWWIDLGDNDTNRVTVDGDRIFVEHWRGRKGDNQFPHTIASGYRAK